MTRRATLRGAERTPLDTAADVIVCGASFAGLAVARELAGSGADVLVLDRYAIGERQTSACAAPTPWLRAMGVERAIRQELPCMGFHTPHGSARFRLPWSWSSFDYRTLCEELWAQCDARFEVALVSNVARSGGGAVPAHAVGAPAPGDAVAEGETRVSRSGGGAVPAHAVGAPAPGDAVAEGETRVSRSGGGAVPAHAIGAPAPGDAVAEGETRISRSGGGAVPAHEIAAPATGDAVAEGETRILGVRTDRGEVSGHLVVDALGWRRVLGAGPNVQPPDAPISRGLEVHPDGGGVDLDVWIDRSLVRRGYAWSVPAAGELRVGVGSYEPRHHVKVPTQELAGRLDLPAVRYQGNWFPHALRPAVEGGVCFVGDSAGHCFPLSGEGIRTAFYFGIACGRELRRVLAGEATRAEALAAYGAFSAAHAPAFRTAGRLQRLIPALPPRALTAVLSVVGRPRPCRRGFTWYLEQAHPRFAAAP